MTATQTTAVTERTDIPARLRSAAGWLTIAAERLESGRTDEAADMVAVGLFAAQTAIDRVGGTVAS